MTKTPISLQDLRRSLYVKAKAEPAWRFWGLYVHVCKRETIREAYEMARSNKRGARYRRGHVRGHRGKRSGEFPEPDTGGTGRQHVSAHAGAEEGDCEGRGRSPRSG